MEAKADNSLLTRNQKDSSSWIQMSAEGKYYLQEFLWERLYEFICYKMKRKNSAATNIKE